MPGFGPQLEILGGRLSEAAGPPASRPALPPTYQRLVYLEGQVDQGSHAPIVLPVHLQPLQHTGEKPGDSVCEQGPRHHLGRQQCSGATSLSRAYPRFFQLTQSTRLTSTSRQERKRWQGLTLTASVMFCILNQYGYFEGCGAFSSWGLTGRSRSQVNC